MDLIHGKSRPVRLTAIILIFIALPVLGYFIYDRYSPGAEERRAFEVQAKKADASIAQLEEALRADTYGGKTPRETLDMLIDALKKGDMDLAGKYFALDVNTQSPDYLTRRKWENGLREASAENRIGSIISALSAVRETDTWDKANLAAFESLGSDGTVEVLVQLKLNKYSGVWKIEGI